MKAQALLSAIKLFGSQRALGNAIGASRQQINNWLNRNDDIPYQYAILLYELSDGIVDLDDLVPKQKLANKIVKNWYSWQKQGSRPIKINKIKYQEKRGKFLQKLAYIENKRGSKSVAPISVDKNYNLLIGEKRFLRNKSLGKTVILGYRLDLEKLAAGKELVDGLGGVLPVCEKIGIGLLIEEVWRENKGQKTELNISKLREIIIDWLDLPNISTYGNLKRILLRGSPDLCYKVEIGEITPNRGVSLLEEYS